jgi:hypothetical protein
MLCSHDLFNLSIILFDFFMVSFGSFCTGIECADLANLTDPHLRVSILSREVGGRAVFSCAQGYGLRGPHEAVCQHTGDWASPLPTCQGITK